MSSKVGGKSGHPSPENCKIDQTACIGNVDYNKMKKNGEMDLPTGGNSSNKRNFH